MPIYEYACTECGRRFEVRQSYSDDPIENCTECGARVRRVLHAAGVIFKGSGWYATDSRPTRSESSSGDNSSSGDASTKSGAPGAEAKPTGTTEPVAAKKVSAPVAAEA